MTNYNIQINTNSRTLAGIAAHVEMEDSVLHVTVSEQRQDGLVRFYGVQQYFDAEDVDREYATSEIIEVSGWKTATEDAIRCFAQDFLNMRDAQKAAHAAAARMLRDEGDYEI